LHRARAIALRDLRVAPARRDVADGTRGKRRISRLGFGFETKSNKRRRCGELDAFVDMGSGNDDRKKDACEDTNHPQPKRNIEEGLSQVEHNCLQSCENHLRSR
jgi:hypothetical protein